MPREEIKERLIGLPYLGGDVAFLFRSFKCTPPFLMLVFSSSTCTPPFFKCIFDDLRCVPLMD